MTDRPGPVEDRESTVLSASEEAALAGSVRQIGGTGRGPLIAGVLIAVAFAVGLIRPWDFLLGNDPGPQDGLPVPSAAIAPDGSAVPASGDPAVRPPEAASWTCGYPDSWRSSTVQLWAKRVAWVKSAVPVVEASGPDDPAIPIEGINGDEFSAIGWCAPVEGPERPPHAATAELFRLEGGTAVAVPYERLEPTSGPDALGELWQTVAEADGTHAMWAPGTYVIRFATPTGAYIRYMGFEIEPAPEDEPSGRPSSSPEPSPEGSPSVGSPSVGSPSVEGSPSESPSP
jgi:hypothetical protein